MGTHTVHASEYVRQSIVLHEVILKETTIITPRFLPSMLWVVFCLECISVVLYLLSAIPAIRKEGFWLFRTELNGMIRPNTRILLPICVFFYCAFDISALVSLLKDIRRKSLISVSAGGISLITYPLLLCTGWTKIWNILRAVPLTKTVNLMSAFFYGFPLLYGGAPIYLITKEIWRINKTFNEYNRNYMMILSGSINSKEILEFNIEALQQVTSMLDSSNKVLLLARLLSLGYLVYVIMAYVLMLFGYSLILQAVRYQIQTFRKSLEQRIPFDGALHVSSNSISISVSSAAIRPPVIQKNAENEVGSPEIRTFQIGSLQCVIPQSSLKSPVDFQVCCNTLITASFCGMNIIVGFNLLGVPTHYSLSNLSCFTITWSSVSWVSSWGIPLGLAIFMASFSTPVKALRENTQRVDEEEEDW
ncbi:hypothetical protein PCASD_19452 [Puccinia coronata f. sp. avenae]|uniref:Uncharacterized protein n=1 Tax=Puccinia coronata f. sp. avenae TaxID=200324 RepID=A0A2N5T955_9BASI|nr:hypothetical protein PCASD_19452 [Puccinia coronata f. sp. avenae]